MVELLPLLFLGFVFGIKHAFEPDHVIAMTAISNKTKSLKKALSYGATWGIGHTLALLIAGIIVLLFSISITKSVATIFESIAGMMIIVLGASVLFELWKEKIHIHVHEHDGNKHAHFHSHRDAKGHLHSHNHYTLFRPLTIGAVHGLAGSAALMLLVLSTVNSILAGILYILVFGIGSILSMAIITSVVSLPFIFTEKIYKNLYTWLKICSALGSIIFGLFYIGRILV